MECPACSKSIPDGSRFCPSCGFRIAGHGEERRVVTVLFADVVGFTALSERRDPEQVKHLVDRCFQWLVADIVSFGGQVDKIIGDAILALFGAPLAHEDDAERAVRAALRMQQTVDERADELDNAVRLRIGVNTGEVLVGALAAGGDYTAMGDVVNTANRLEIAAQPGEVLVGASTVTATGRAIPYVERGVVPAKGRDQPVRAWLAQPPLTAPGDRPDRTTGPLVGRDREVTTLRDVATTALANERASLLVLLGDAGMGKSRVVAEVADELTSGREALLLQGRCLPYGDVNAWWPLADALRGILPAGIADPREVIEPRLRALVAEETGRDLTDRSVTRLTSGLIQLFGFDTSRDGPDQDRAREEASRSFITLLDEMTQRRPVVLWLSELHWADAVVRDLIETTLSALARRPLVVMITARRSLLQRWSPPVGRFDTFALNLEPLDEAATDQLIDRLLGERGRATVGEAAKVELRERSGGNPLFLVELLALLDEQTNGDGMVQDALAGMPATLRGLIAARLDNLAPAERAVVDDASVLGRRGKVDHLSEMARQVRGIDDVQSELAAVVARDLIRVTGDTWEFTSDLTREVAYGMLTKSDRAKKHLGVAQWIEASYADDWNDRIVDLLAHHYGQAAELLNDLGTVSDLSSDVRERALHWIDEAGARSERLRLLPAVERLCTQGLTLADGNADQLRLTLLLRRARARVQARDAPGAHDDAVAAAALAETLGDDSVLGAFQLIEGELAQQRGDLDGARATFAHAVEYFDDAGDEERRAEALRSLGMTELFAGRTAEAERTTNAAREAFRALGRRTGEAWALQNLAWISFAQGRIDDAEKRVDESLELFGETDDAGGASWARGLHGFVRLAQGDLEGAEALQQAVLADAQAGGDRWATAMMLLLGSVVRLWTGRTEAAVDAATEGLALFGQVYDRLGQARIAWPLARGLAMRGDVEGARTVLDEVKRSIDDAKSGQDTIEDRAIVSVARATVEGHLGCPEAALDELADLTDKLGLTHAAQVLRHPDDEGISPEWVGMAMQAGAGTDLLTATAMALLQSGRVHDAAAILEVAAERAGPSSTSAALTAHLGLIDVARGRTTEAVELAGRVLADEKSSYLDRTFAGMASALAAAREGDGMLAADRFRATRRTVDATGDLLSQRVVQLGEARCAEALGNAPVSGRVADVQRRFDEMGVDAHGWHRAFDLCLGVEVGVEPHR